MSGEPDFAFVGWPSLYDAILQIWDWDEQKQWEEQIQEREKFYEQLAERRKQGALAAAAVRREQEAMAAAAAFEFSTPTRPPLMRSRSEPFARGRATPLAPGSAPPDFPTQDKMDQYLELFEWHQRTIKDKVDLWELYKSRRYHSEDGKFSYDNEAATFREYVATKLLDLSSAAKLEYFKDEMRILFCHVKKIPGGTSRDAMIEWLKAKDQRYLEDAIVRFQTRNAPTGAEYLARLKDARRAAKAAKAAAAEGGGAAAADDDEHIDVLGSEDDDADEDEGEPRNLDDDDAFDKEEGGATAEEVWEKLRRINKDYDGFIRHEGSSRLGDKGYYNQTVMVPDDGSFYPLDDQDRTYNIEDFTGAPAYFRKVLGLAEKSIRERKRLGRRAGQVRQAIVNTVQPRRPSATNPTLRPKARKWQFRA